MEDLTIQDLVWINLAMQRYGKIHPQMNDMETYQATLQKMEKLMEERATKLGIYGIPVPQTNK